MIIKWRKVRRAYSCEVTSESSVDDDEDVSVGQLLEAEEDSSGEDPDEHLQIEEERWPSRRLMLRDRRDDGNWKKKRVESDSVRVRNEEMRESSEGRERRLTVNLGVSSVPEGVKSTSPRSNGSRHGHGDESSERDGEDGDDEDGEEGLELFRWEVGSDDLDEGDELKETEDTCNKDGGKLWPSACSKRASGRTKEARTHREQPCVHSS